MDAAHDAHITERHLGAMWARDKIGGSTYPDTGLSTPSTARVSGAK